LGDIVLEVDTNKSDGACHINLSHALRDNTHREVYS